MAVRQICYGVVEKSHCTYIVFVSISLRHLIHVLLSARKGVFDFLLRLFWHENNVTNISYFETNQVTHSPKDMAVPKKNALQKDSDYSSPCGAEDAAILIQKSCRKFLERNCSKDVFHDSFSWADGVNKPFDDAVPTLDETDETTERESAEDETREEDDMLYVFGEQDGKQSWWQLVFATLLGHAHSVWAVLVLIWSMEGEDDAAALTAMFVNEGEQGQGATTAPDPASRAANVSSER